MQKLFIIFIFFIQIWLTYANFAEHLVISEVVYGNTNSKDEFIEIYNPTENPINLQDFWLKVHIRNKSGSSDSNKTITWNNETIPAHGFFLFASKTSINYLDIADATYSPSLVSNGAVYISTSRSKMQNIIDFISYGSHTTPTGYENENTTNPWTKKSIERKSDEEWITENEWNSYDTDWDDFQIIDTPNPQNSESEVENPPTQNDNISPSQISELKCKHDTENNLIDFNWINPNDTDFSSVFLSYKLNENETFSTPISITKNTFTIEDLETNKDYDFKFYTQYNSENNSENLKINLSCLASIQNLENTEIQDNQLSFSWNNPVHDQLIYIKANINWGENILLWEDWEAVENHDFIELLSDHDYNFEFYATYFINGEYISSAKKNISASTTGCYPDNNEVHINEINWAGMAAIYGEEQALSYWHRYQWIELFNNWDRTIDLDGWKITTDQGHEIILNSLNSFPKDFLLLQNSEMDIFTWEIFSDLFYEDPDSSTRLDSEITNIKLINECWDILETIPTMFKWDYSSYRSMAKISPELDWNLESSWFNEKLNWSPKVENSYKDVNLSIAYLTPSPYFPTPNEDFIIQATVASLQDDEIYSNDWSIEILNENDEVISVSSWANLLEYADNTIINLSLEWLDEWTYSLHGRIICSKEDCGTYSTLDQNIEIKNYPRINEIYPKPRDDNNEWIELHNPLDIEFDSIDSQICRNSDCITLTENIPANSFYIIEETDTNKFTWDWIWLTDTSAKLTWKTSEWVETDIELPWEDWWDPDIPEYEWEEIDKIIDIFEYESASVAQSFLRNPAWQIIKDSHITKWLINTYNQNPSAVITIQGSGNTSGNTPFSFNPTWEDSSDPDWDSLSFTWNFWNWEYSYNENPTWIKYETAWTYIVQLTINDWYGGIISSQQELVVTQSGSWSSTSTISLKTTSLTKSSSNKFIFSKISVNADEDWIEIKCPSCEKDTSLSWYQLYDDKIFYTFTSTFINKNLPVVIRLVKEWRTSLNEIIVEKSWLTKTDEQLLLLNSSNQIEDWVCWNNFDTTQSNTEISEENNLKSSWAWTWSCINSTNLTARNSVMIRENNLDTNSRKDWFVLEVQPLEEVSKPLSIDDVDLFIEEIDFKNTESDKIIINCWEYCNNLFWFSLFVNGKNIYSISSVIPSPDRSRGQAPAGISDSKNSTDILQESKTDNLQLNPSNPFNLGSDKFASQLIIDNLSLISTDSTISIKDSYGDYEDFVCWSNRIWTETRKNDLSDSVLELITNQNIWNWECLDSSVVKENDYYKKINNKFILIKKIQPEIIPEIKYNLRWIILSETLINPKWKDKNNEWIEIQNFLDQVVILQGWILKINNKSIKLDNIQINPKQFFLIRNRKLSFSLNNSKWIISLINPKWIIINQIKYNFVLEWISLSKNSKHWFQWTKIATPRKENIISSPFSKNIKDTDQDWISDEDEKKIWTNWLKSDTDWDWMSDLFEINNNLSPFEKNNPEVFWKYLITNLKTNISLPTKKKKTLRIYGKTEPFAKIKVLIHSTVSKYSTTANEKWSWSIYPKILEKGNHTYEIQITDKNWIMSKFTEKFNFILENHYIKKLKKSKSLKRNNNEIESITTIEKIKKIEKKNNHKDYLISIIVLIIGLIWVFIRKKIINS